MREISSIFLSVAIIVLAGGAGAAGEEEPLRDVISAQWARYKEGLKAYQFRKTISHYDLLTGKESVNHVSFEHKQRGTWRLFGLESKERGSSVEAANDHYSFTLGKDKTWAWVLKDLNLRLSDSAEVRDVSEPTADYFHVYSPYTFGTINGTLPTLLKRPGFSVTKTDLVTTPMEGFTKVWFKVVADEISAKQTGSIPIEGNGWVLLDPKSYWRILEFELPLYSPRFPKSRAIAKYQYDMAPDNFPLLKQIDITFYPPSSEKAEDRVVIDYVLEKRVPGEEEFRLSGFGLPEPMGTPPIARPVRWHLWLIGAAVATAALAFVFGKMKRRFAGAKPPAGQTA